MKPKLIKKSPTKARYSYKGTQIDICLVYPGPAVEVSVQISPTESKTISRNARSFAGALAKAVEYIDGGNSND